MFWEICQQVLRLIFVVPVWEVTSCWYIGTVYVQLWVPSNIFHHLSSTQLSKPSLSPTPSNTVFLNIPVFAVISSLEVFAFALYLIFLITQSSCMHNEKNSCDIVSRLLKPFRTLLNVTIFHYGIYLPILVFFTPCSICYIHMYIHVIYSLQNEAYWRKLYII